MGLRVRSGLSAALSQRDIRYAKELWHIQRKPPLGGGGRAGERGVVYPRSSRRGTSRKKRRKKNKGKKEKKEEKRERGSGKEREK